MIVYYFGLQMQCYLRVYFHVTAVRLN